MHISISLKEKSCYFSDSLHFLLLKAMGPRVLTLDSRKLLHFLFNFLIHKFLTLFIDRLISKISLSFTVEIKKKKFTKYLLLKRPLLQLYTCNAYLKLFIVLMCNIQHKKQQNKTSYHNELHITI